MKTYCFYLGRGTGDPVAGALFTTKYDLFDATYFTEMLNELITILDTSFTGQFHTKDGFSYITFTAEDTVADILVGQFYNAFANNFPNLEIKLIPDFVDDITHKYELASTELVQHHNFVVPINTAADFKTDTLSPLINAFLNLPTEDRIIIQAVIQPIKDTAMLHWKFARNVRWHNFFEKFNAKYWFKKEALSKIEERIKKKSKCVMYKMTLRLAAYRQIEPNDPKRLKTRKILKERLSALVGGYAQLGDPDLNLLCPTPVVYGERALKPLKNRSFGHTMILSHEEAAAIWHPTGTISNTFRIMASHVAPPPELPYDQNDPNISFFGQTNFRDNTTKFGFSQSDRKKHLYIVGKSGSGKSCLLQLLVKNDMESGKGVAVIDPHGDLIDHLLHLVPKHRVNDVIILDPSDKDFPACFNPMAWVPENLRMQVTLGIVEIFHKLFGGAWHDQLELLIRYMSFALLSTHNATLLSIEKMLVDENYRLAVAGEVSDDGVRNFWLHEFPDWASQHQGDTITPLLDVLRQFLSTDMIRNIVAQPVNKFDLRSIMDSKKILFVKVSKGLLGNETATLFGSLVVSKIYQAAMSRADIPENLRRDFFLYIDEFQTFASQNIKEMLAESRKYHLNLTLAHQFLGQIPGEVAKTIFGNVGNFVSFCVSGEDAGTVSSELSGSCDSVSLTNLPLREFYVRMVVDDKVLPPFSGRTIDVVYPERDYADECIAISRGIYAVPLKKAQEMITHWEKGDNYIERPELLGEPQLDMRQHLRRYGTVLQVSNLEITNEHLIQLSHTAFDNVKELDLSNTQISDQGLNSVVNLKNLVKLNLTSTKISNNGLKSLTMLPRLNHLVLDRTVIGDEGLLNLKNSKIKELSLRETNVTDKGLNTLSEYNDLVEIALENTSVSQKGVERFKAKKPQINIHHS